MEVARNRRTANVSFEDVYARMSDRAMRAKIRRRICEALDDDWQTAAKIAAKCGPLTASEAGVLLSELIPQVEVRKANNQRQWRLRS